MALVEIARVQALGGRIWILGRFFDNPAGPVRRELSRLLTFLGGAV